MIGKSFLSCADIAWRENLFSSHTARTRATQYYNGRLRPVQEGKNLRRKTKMVNGRNVRLSFQEVGPREKTCTSINNKLKWNDNSKGDCTSPGILIQELIKTGKAGKWRWKGGLGDSSEFRSTEHERTKGSGWTVPTWKVVVVLMKENGDCLPLGSSIEVKRDQTGRSGLVSKSQCRGENTVGTIQLCRSQWRTLSIPLNTVFPQYLVDQDRNS